MNKRDERLIDLITWLILLAALVILFVKTASAQEGGCSAVPTVAGADRRQLVDSILLAPAIPDSISPDGKAQGAFYQNALDVNFSEGGRVLLSSTPDGSGQLCVDDYYEIRAFPSGLVDKHDFRDRAISRIEPTSAIDVTYLFQAGQNHLEITLIDLTGPAFSGFPLYLVMVDPPPPMPTSTPSLTPTATSTSTPTSTSTTTPKSSPTATPTPTPTILPLAPSSPPNTSSPSFLDPTRPDLARLVPMIALGLFMLGGFVVWRRSRRVLPVGQLELYSGGSYVETVNLPQFGKAIVTLGSSGDVRLSGDRMPGVAARITAHRASNGVVEAYYEVLDPKDPETVLESKSLRDKEELNLASYHLIYRHFAQADEEITAIGDLYHV